MSKSRILKLKFDVQVQDDTIVLSYGPFKANSVVRKGIRKGRVASLPLSHVDMQTDRLFVPVFFHDSIAEEPEWVTEDSLTYTLFG
jgi:hypothetical protein